MTDGRLRAARAVLAEGVTAESSLHDPLVVDDDGSYSMVAVCATGFRPNSGDPQQR
jgi:hypothetical protein